MEESGLKSLRKQLSQKLKPLMAGWKLGDKYSIVHELLYDPKLATCQICGYRTEYGAIEEHHVVPQSFTEKLGLPKSEVIRVCSNCHEELGNWCTHHDCNTPDDYSRATQEFTRYKRGYIKGAFT